MPAIEPDQYCLLWINSWATCLTKAEWASWMQATGSIIALVVGTWIPMRFRAEEREQRARDAVSKAHVAGARVVVKISQIHAFIVQLREAIAVAAEHQEPLRFDLLDVHLRGLAFPANEEIMALMPLGDAIAADAAQATECAQQILHYLDLMREHDLGQHTKVGETVSLAALDAEVLLKSVTDALVIFIDGRREIVGSAQV